MPQMSPLNWLILFNYFIIILIMISIIKYFMILYTPASVLMIQFVKKSSDWKW